MFDIESHLAHVFRMNIKYIVLEGINTEWMTLTLLSVRNFARLPLFMYLYFYNGFFHCVYLYHFCQFMTSYSLAYCARDK